MKLNKKNKLFILNALVLCFCGSSWGGMLDGIFNKGGVLRVFEVKAESYSYIEGEPVESFKSYSGGTSGGGLCSWGIRDETTYFRVEFYAKKKSGKLKANVQIVPRGNDKRTEKKSLDIDFSDLQPRSFLLSKNDEGRCYYISLYPKIRIIDKRPKRANDGVIGVEKWSFDKSMVIFNDCRYAGKLSCFGGPMAYVSYPGIAKVTFSLEPFDGGKKIGILEEGRVQITNTDGQSLEIYNVKNGYYKMVLPGGPYQVWACWEESKDEGEYKIPPKEQWVLMMKKKLAEMGAKIPDDGEFDNAYENLQHERHLPLSSGVGKFKVGDIK